MSEAAQSYQETSDVVLGVIDVLKRVFSRWQILVAGVVLGIGAALLLPRFVLPIYRAQTTLMYRNTVTPESVILDRERVETWRDRGTRYRELVTTRTNLEQVVSQLGLYPDIVAKRGLEMAAEKLRGDLGIAMPSGTLISLSFSYSEKEKLIPVLERIASDFKRQPLVDSVEEAKATKSFLDGQYAAAAKELAEKEQKLASFIASHPEFAQAERGPGGGIGARLQASDAPAGESRETSLRRQIARIESRLAGLDEASAGAQPKLPPQTRTVPADQQRIDAAQRVVGVAAERLAQLRAQFTEAHPDVQAAKAELGKAQAELSQARQAARTEVLPDLSVPPGATSAEARAALADQLKRLKAELAFVGAADSPTRKPTAKEAAFVDSLVTLETDWVSLQREAEDARQRHSSIGQRLFQADTIVKLVSLAGAGQIVTIDEAYEPQLPSARGKLGTMLKGFGGMVGLAFAVALALALMDDRVYRVQSLRVIGEHDAILAAIPAAQMEEK